MNAYSSIAPIASAQVDPAIITFAEYHAEQRALEINRYIKRGWDPLERHSSRRAALHHSRLLRRYLEAMK